MIRRLHDSAPAANVWRRAPYARGRVDVSLVENGCGLDRATPIRQGFDSAAEYAKDVGDAAGAERNADRVLQPLRGRQRVADVNERSFELTERTQGARGR